MATHPPWNEEYNQSYLVRSNPVYVTHINKGLGETKTAKWEYSNVLILDHCTNVSTIILSKVDLQILQAHNLDQ